MHLLSGPFKFARIGVVLAVALGVWLLYPGRADVFKPQDAALGTAIRFPHPVFVTQVPGPDPTVSPHAGQINRYLTTLESALSCTGCNYDQVQVLEYFPENTEFRVAEVWEDTPRGLEKMKRNLARWYTLKAPDGTVQTILESETKNIGAVQPALQRHYDLLKQFDARKAETLPLTMEVAMPAPVIAMKLPPPYTPALMQNVLSRPVQLFDRMNVKKVKASPSIPVVEFEADRLAVTAILLAWNDFNILSLSVLEPPPADDLVPPPERRYLDANGFPLNEKALRALAAYNQAMKEIFVHIYNAVEEQKLVEVMQAVRTCLDQETGLPGDKLDSLVWQNLIDEAHAGVTADALAQFDMLKHRNKDVFQTPGGAWLNLPVTGSEQGCKDLPATPLGP